MDELDDLHTVQNNKYAFTTLESEGLGSRKLT